MVAETVFELLFGEMANNNARLLLLEAEAARHLVRAC
jgi:hypothetical protein